MKMWTYSILRNAMMMKRTVRKYNTPRSIRRLITHPIRNAILALLAQKGSATFNEIGKTTRIPLNRLSLETCRLEVAGFITSKREFVGRRTQTTYFIRTLGETVFAQYPKKAPYAGMPKQGA